MLISLGSSYDAPEVISTSCKSCAPSNMPSPIRSKSTWNWPHNQSEPSRQAFSEASQHFETMLASLHQGLYQNCISKTKLRLLSFKESELIQTHIFKSSEFGDFSSFQSPPLAFVNPKPFLLYPWLNLILTIKEICSWRGNITKEGLSFKFFEKKNICINHI